MSQYYDGTKLLSLKDINGETPEIYICTTNRTGGKTTYFGRMFVRRFLKYGEKFCLVYRFNYELDECADSFYKDISTLFFPDTVMTSQRRASGIYHELFIDEKPCGYAISLNSADQIKKKSHLFSDVQRMLFDEFISETNHYCTDEVNKFISVHTSIARGQGKMYRYVPVIMLGNPYTMLNPYYVEFGIAERLTDKTKYLRGEGFVMEQGYVDSANQAQKESAFNRAFSRNKYVAYSSEGIYLNDNKSFVERPEGASRYIATLRYNGNDYAIREYATQGILYCDDKPDNTYPNKLTVSADDHQINYVMLKRNDIFLSNLRYFFEKGCFRFKDLKCKEVILHALSY